MKKRTVKQLLTCLLIFTVLSCAVTGCGNDSRDVREESKTGSEEKSSERETKSSEAEAEGFEHDPNLSEPGVEPICNEKVKLTIGLAQRSNVENYDTNYYTKMLEDTLNIDIEFYYYTEAEVLTQIDLMVNGGGSELPDIILNKLDEETVYKYGEAGMLLPLNDYYENSSFYLAQAIERVKEADGVDAAAQLRTYDGNIYAVPEYTGSYLNPVGPSAFWLYRPWMEALDLEVPTTPEELRDVLYAFKTRDPNGNGKADEIPAMGSNLNATFGIRLLSFCIDPYVRVNSGTYFLDIKNGKVAVSYITDEFKQGLKYVKGLVEEGLIDPVTFSQDDKTWKSILQSEGDQLLGSFCHMSDAQCAKEDKNQWILVPPLKNDAGESHASLLGNQVYSSGFITKNCKNPEAAFRLLDYMYKEDVMCTARWGIRGENWDYVSDLKQEDYPNYNLSNTFAGYPATILEYNGIFGSVQNANWNITFPALRTNGFTAGASAAAVKPGTTQEQQSLTMPKYYEAGPEVILSKASFHYASPEEAVEATETANLLSNYVKEKMSLWCTGNGDIDAEWDGYLKELEAMGLSGWLDTMQKAYER